MSLDLFALQQQILTRLAGLSAEIPVVGFMDRIDLSDSVIYPVAAQTFFLNFSPEGQVGKSAAHAVHWSFDVLIDTGRANDAQKTAAAALFSAALAALVGWEFSPGIEVHTSAGQDSLIEGRTLRISFGFTLPVYLAG